MAQPEIDTSGRDDLDALFEVDQSMDDIFNAVRQQRDDDTIRVPKDVQYGGGGGAKKKDGTAENDVDEEIKITKKRKPIAKLDEARLLSENGIPRLRTLAKTTFKHPRAFKGKGHEFSDAARLLRYYQLWLDELYPRAKFADGLAMIEKLGHSRRMQMQRRAWIEEGKPRGDGVEDGRDQHEEEEKEKEDEASAEKGEDNGGHGGDIFAGDESDASVDPFEALVDGEMRKLAKEDRIDDEAYARKFTRGQEPSADLEPDEDELDALLAMEDNFQAAVSNIGKQAAQSRPEPSFEDDEEAMREMDDMW